MAELVPSKGTVHAWPVETLLTNVRFLGYPRLVIRTDGEPAILDVRLQLAAQLRVRHGMEITEETAADSAANGLAEGSVRDMKACIRTLHYALQATYGDVSPRHVILPFMVRYAAFCYNVGQVGRDGLTPWQRIKGKKFGKTMVPFAEVVMWHRGGPSRYDGRWEKAERVDKELFDKIDGRPWQLDPAGASMAEARVVLGVPPEVDMEAERVQSAASSKRVYIRRDRELVDHGYTDGCLGCNAARLGWPPRPHTEACRARIEQAMADTEQGKQRLGEAVARKRAAPSSGHEEIRAGGPEGPVPVETEAEDIPMEERDKRKREEDEERVVRARLAAALSRLGCGTLRDCWQDMSASTFCQRICDLRGSECVHELDDSAAEVVVHSNMSEAVTERVVSNAHCVHAKEKSIAIVHSCDDLSLGQQVCGLVTYSLGALRLTTNWEPLKERMESKCDACALDMRLNDGSEYERLENLAKTVVSMPTVRPQFKGTQVQSQLYGAFTKQGVGITMRSWKRNMWSWFATCIGWLVGAILVSTQGSW
eukprot:3853846-Amphidinium_carterae.3